MISLIQPANPADAHLIANVICDSIHACHADHHNDPNQIASWTANKTADNIKHWIAQNFAVSFFDKNNLVGFAMLSPKGEVLLNYVVPNQQGKGVGKAMLQAIIQHAKSQNLTKIYLESTKTAKDFYQSQGFMVKNDVVEEGKVVAFEMILPL